MQLFVGLGNPGDKYRNTRHNIGFMAVDRIWNKTDGTPWKAKFQAEATAEQKAKYNKIHPHKS